LITFSRNIY